MDLEERTAVSLARVERAAGGAVARRSLEAELAGDSPNHVKEGKR